MHRIDTKTAQKDKFGAGKNGFTRGNPQTGTPATDLDDDYFDMLQEELCSVVEASGASLEKGRHDQLLTALRSLLLSRKNPFGDIKLDGTVKTALENLGLRETGSSGEKIPLLSTENTWIGKQIFSGGAAGELDGNAATATKLKTPVRIDGVEFDGSADISLRRDIIDYDALQHKVIHDIDYAGIFDGADNMSQGFCICDTPQGTRMFLHQPVSGGVRIVETTFNPDGENENPTVISFSPVFADIGHQSIGAVCEDGRVMLYTPTADGKGVNIINWNGADTSLTDVTRTEIFTSDFFTGDEIITVALSADGSLLIVQSGDEAVHLHYNRDDRRTVYVFDRASLTFKHRIYLSTQSMVSQAFQGMASDGHYLFAYYGYTGVFLTHRIVVYNLSTGEVVRQFNVDGVRARYGRQKMLGNAELGYPVLQEAEGLALHNGKLYLLDMDFWCQTADVVSFEGAYFAARATNFSGRSPVNPSYWTPTAYGTAAATKYDATKSYTCGVATKRSKAVVSVEAYDGTGYLVDSGVAFPDSHASLFLSPNAVNIALSPNEDFQVAAYEQNLRSHRPLFEVRKEAPDTDTSAAVFRLYGDAFRTGEYTGRFVQWKHRLNAVHDCLEIRADVDLLSGGGINLYSMNDTQSAGRTRLYCTDGSETWSVLLSPVSPAFHPDQDKAMNLGSSPNRWNVAYLQGVNIKSDDETQKRMTISTTLKAGAFQVSTAGNLGIYDDSADAYVIAARSDGTAFMQMDTDINGAFRPSVNNTSDLGAPNKAFRSVYLCNSPTVVSDATLKDTPRDATAAENAAFAEIARLPGVWRWLQRIKEEGEDARLHAGPTVQAAIAVMEKHGLDWRKYSAFCLDSWEAEEAQYEDIPEEYEDIPVQPAIYSDEGELLSGTTRVLTRQAERVLVRPATEAGSRYRFRKEELLWWCLRAVVSQVDVLTESISALTRRVDLLEE